MNKDPHEIEYRLHQEGLNPMMGTFKRTFEFSPSCYESRRKKAFIEQIHNELQDIKYVYYGEVRVLITLYLNEQT